MSKNAKKVKNVKKWKKRKKCKKRQKCKKFKFSRDFEKNLRSFIDDQRFDFVLKKVHLI